MAYRAAVPDTPVAGNIFSGVGTGDGNLIHLSNGHAIALIGGVVYYSADHLTWTQVASVSGPNIPASLCRDASDNLFVVYGSGTTFRVAALRRSSSSYAWTQVADSGVNLGGNTVSGVRVRWVNTGWTAGRLLVLATMQGNYFAYATNDLAAFIAGTSQPQWVAVTSAATIGSGAVGNYLNLHGNEFGSTRCITTRPRGDGSSWIAEAQVIDVVGQGTPSVGTSMLVNQPNYSGTGTNLLARIGVDKWVFIYATQPNETYYWARIVTPSAVSTGVRGPNIQFQMPAMSSARGFSVQEDPTTPGRVTILSTADGNSNNSITVKRLSLTVSGDTITWDTATAAVDTFATPANNFGDTGEVYSVRSLVSPVGDLMYRSVATYNSGNGATTERALTGALSYNTAPNAASKPTPEGTFDRTQPKTFSYTFSDADPGDQPSKTDWRWRTSPSSGTPGSWNTSTVTGNSTSITYAANTFAAGRIEVQAWPYDSQGVSPGVWSESAFATAADPPPAPTFSAPAAGSTISGPSVTATIVQSTLEALQWRVLGDTSGAADPTKVVNAGATIEDASVRSFTATGLLNASTVHLQARYRRDGLWSPWADNGAQPVSFTPPPLPVITLTPDSARGSATEGTLLVGWAIPAPSGSEPTVTLVDVAIDDGTIDGRRRLFAGIAPGTGSGGALSGSVRHWTPAATREYGAGTARVTVTAIGANGTTRTASS